MAADISEPKVLAERQKWLREVGNQKIKELVLELQRHGISSVIGVDVGGADGVESSHGIGPECSFPLRFVAEFFECDCDVDVLFSEMVGSDDGRWDSLNHSAVFSLLKQVAVRPSDKPHLFQ